MIGNATMFVGGQQDFGPTITLAVCQTVQDEVPHATGGKALDIFQHNPIRFVLWWQVGQHVTKQVPQALVAFVVDIGLFGKSCIGKGLTGRRQGPHCTMASGKVGNGQLFHQFGRYRKQVGRGGRGGFFLGVVFLGVACDTVKILPIHLIGMQGNVIGMTRSQGK